MSQNVLKFIQTICYAGLEIENWVKSRVRIYREMKTKTLLTLPPDPKSMVQVILRIHHQLYYWLRLDSKEIDVINMEKFGWSVQRESRSFFDTDVGLYLFIIYYFLFIYLLTIYFTYAHEIFGTLMKEDIFELLWFHVIIHQMETESSLWKLLTWITKCLTGIN